MDDAPQTLRYIRHSLAGAGYQSVVTGEPEEGLSLMEAERPALVLLDLMLADADGFELMQNILDIADVLVIFVSAYGQRIWLPGPWTWGAADYMVKPFSPTELTARIRVTLAGRPVAMVAMEYRLLAELSAHASRVLTYEYLQKRAWGEWGKGDLQPMRTIVGHAAPQAGRQRAKLHLHLHRAPRRLPHAGRHGTEPPITSRPHESGRIASPTAPRLTQACCQDRLLTDRHPKVQRSRPP